MIFNVVGHIGLIRDGLKTQTRRLNRGIYQVGRDYAVQRKRGVKAETDIRIVMDRIREEEAKQFLVSAQGVKYPCEIYITKGNAFAEGDYTPARFEGLFRELNPKWDGWSRWVFEFHVIETKNSKEEQQKLERSLKHLHQEITEHIHPYVTTKIEKIKRRC